MSRHGLLPIPIEDISAIRTSANYKKIKIDFVSLRFENCRE